MNCVNGFLTLLLILVYELRWRLSQFLTYLMNLTKSHFLPKGLKKCVFCAIRFKRLLISLCHIYLHMR